MEREQTIEITGLFGIKFIAVKLNENKFMLYQGEKETMKNYIGTLNSLDNVYDAV